MKNKISIVALDTNAFLELAHVSAEISKDCKKGSFHSYLRDMKRLNLGGHLKFVITPTVLKEILRCGKKIKQSAIDREIKFLQECCEIYVPENEAEFAEKVEELAGKYLDKKIIFGTEKRHNDALILAEATLCGLNLISNNVRDFQYYVTDKNSERKNKRRAKDIMRFNESEGFGYSNIEGKRIVPCAYTSEEFIKLFRTGLFLGDMNVNREFGLGD